jgi:hypothetical protein
MANIEAYRTDVPLYQVVEHIVGDLDPLAALQRSSKIAAWDHALKDLIDAVSLAKLKARGRLPGSQLLEAISSGDFAEVADNPHANFDLTIEYGGKRVLEFNDTKATIVKSHSIGPPKVMWTDVCAESGAEILKIWPAPLLAMANLNAADGVRESEGMRRKSMASILMRPASRRLCRDCRATRGRLKSGRTTRRRRLRRSHPVRFSGLQMNSKDCTPMA